ncbi:Nn.00g092810.m01.CDS01 [Neocucurbitaria sp. VM-36]
MSASSLDLSKVPLAPNPNGLPPNFIDPPSLEPAFLGVGISLIAISAILLTIRLFANCKQTGKLWFDDFLCILAWVTSVGYWILFKTLVDDGTARHAWDIPASMVTSSYVKRLLAQQILGNFSMWAVKACILALFIRLFDSIRWIRITAWTLIASVGLFYLAAIAVWAAYCTPRAGEDWGVTALARASSQGITGLVVAIGVVGLVVDCIMFALPFPIILGLNMRTPKKVGLLIVFAVAFCTVVAACASLAYRIVAFQGARGDPTWVGMNVCITSTAEQFGTVIVSCAPGLASFWYNIFTKSRIYSSLHSIILHRPSSATNGEYAKAEPHRYASDENLANVKMKKYDPYQVTDLGTRSGGSEDGSYPEERFIGPGGFITSAIPDSRHAERVSNTG